MNLLCDQILFMRNKFVYIVVVHILVVILLLFALYQEINIDLFDGNAAEDSFSVSSKDALLPPPIDSSSITRVERLPPLPPPKKR